MSFRIGLQDERKQPASGWGGFLINTTRRRLNSAALEQGCLPRLPGNFGSPETSTRCVLPSIRGPEMGGSRQHQLWSGADESCRTSMADACSGLYVDGNV
ncbi:hypothetical protein [Rhodopirellula sallentina]|uniref:Uncharacterized protein n=1 Tax=Rhodopirellula sallentina SM41 TaxID=1263870 RepID=M5U3K6_9BACT|nr:hypothetical protein [Rhodopirellula sallentina]EMI56037.1 hypothetical protein RSSM_02535 [Rhodopirellula sallentina SM41]